MWKILWITSGYLAALSVLALTLYFTSPGPMAQEILGVVIASGYEETFISGRKLSCTPKRWNITPLSICSININGTELVIHASRNPLSHSNQLGGNCSAFYDGESQPCNVTSKTERFHWVARVYISELTEIQQAVLRRRYFFHNLPEKFHLYTLFIVSGLTAFIFGLAVHLGNRRQARLKSMLLMSSITVGLVTGVFTFFLWYVIVVSVVI